MDLFLGYKITYFISALGGFFILIFIYSKGINKKFNLLYALLNISFIFWAVGRLALFFVDSVELALIWSRILHIGSILVHIFFLHTVLVFIKRDKSRIIPLIIFYLNSLFVLFLNLSDLFFGTTLFLNDLRTKFGFPWVVEPSGFYHLHLANELIIPSWVFLEMILAYRKSVGIFKLQLRYIIISSILGFVGGNSVILLIYNINISPILVFLVPVQFFTMTYAIFKHRLMDIRLLIFRSIVFGLIIFITAGIFSVISALITSAFTSLAGIRSSIISSLIVVVLITIFYQALRNLIERATNTFLYKKTYNPNILISTINRITSSILDLQHLLSSIIKTLSAALHFEKAGVTLLNKNKKLELTYFQGIKKEVAEGLINYPNVVSILNKEIKQTPGIMVIDEMKTRFDNNEFKPVDPALLKLLHQEDIALVIPLYAKEQLIGLLSLGEKKSGDPYTNQDLRVLGIIAGQAAIAIENARLYEELKYFNVKLEDQVKQKTSQLRSANSELRQLDTAKSEFISIASHQLRAPLTVIKGYISMMREGSFGKISPKVLNNLEKVYISNERLIGLVENLLDISRIESGRQHYQWAKVSLEDLAVTIIDNLKRTAKDKGVKLFFHKPKKALPKVTADEAKLHEVMINFVDNAIKYTPKGEINVSLEVQPDDTIRFCVQDTGRGIAPEVKTHLFQKFSRGKGSFRVHTEGVGLGLYVAKMLIDAHGGKIWAESKGRNKGSKFCFSIPLNFKPKEDTPVPKKKKKK